MAFRSFCLGLLMVGFFLKAGAEVIFRTGGIGRDALGLISEVKGE